jgi:hypothetical protein
MPTKTRLADLENIEEYLRSLQKLEITLRDQTGNNPIHATIVKYAAMKAFYEDPAVLMKLKAELQTILAVVVKRSGNAGTLMGEKALERFISGKELSMEALRQKRLVTMLTDRQARDRMAVYLMTLEKETSILNADIQIYKMNAKIAGFTDQQILEQLVSAGKDNVGLTAQFEKSSEKMAIAAARREAQSKSFDEYRQAADPNEEWEWITISSKPCPDCIERGGKVLSLDDWQAIGTPGDGRTICGSYCMCQLIPVSISADMFPDQKSFKYDLKETVLTTAKELRLLNSAKAEE